MRGMQRGDGGTGRALGAAGRLARARAEHGAACALAGGAGGSGPHGTGGAYGSGCAARPINCVGLERVEVFAECALAAAPGVAGVDCGELSDRRAADWGGVAARETR